MGIVDGAEGREGGDDLRARRLAALELPAGARARLRPNGFVVLTGSKFALEHLAGEIAHAVNHSRRWSAQLEALSGAAEAIELALANR